MKRYQIYRNIRKKAMIYGLPVPFFGLMVLILIGSLLVIIFSFGIGSVAGAVIFNSSSYLFLTRLSKNPHLLRRGSVFPKVISNKKCSGLSDEN